MDDCIVISDDEDIEVLDQFITCEPILIDLTESPVKNGPASPIQRPSPAAEPPIPPLKPSPWLFRAPHPTFCTRKSPFGQSPPRQQDSQSPISSPMKQTSFTQRARPEFYPSQPQATTPPPPPPPPPPPQPPSPPPPLQQTSERDMMLAKKELGNHRYRTNHLNDAVKLYREAGDLARKIGDNELLAILHFNLAMTYSRLGSYNQAADECAAAVKIDEKYMKAHCKRAEIYMSQGKFDEAVICYEYICEMDPTMKDEAMKRIYHAREMSKRKRKLDQYEILGLTPNFTIADMRKVYRKKARDHHPDRHSDADVVTRRIHEKIFKEASEAYAFFQKRFGFH